MKKRLLLISALIAAALISAAALSGCGGIEYALVSSGNVSAEGLIYDLYENGEASVTGRNGTETDLVIPASVDGHRVKSVAARAFEGQTGIITLKIEGKPEEIGEFAFSEVASLMTADLGGTASVASCAFYGCENLTRVTGAGRLSSIGEMAFCGCRSLASFDFSKTLSSIGERAFGQCDSLAYIKLPKSVKTLGAGAFEGCRALACADLSALSLNSVPDGMFVRCTSLSRVDFSSSLRSIGMQAFRGCESLETLCLPASLTEICDSAFFGCDALATVNYAGSESKWKSVAISEGNDPLTALRPYPGVKQAKAPVTSPSGKQAGYLPPSGGEGEFTEGEFAYSVLADGRAEITGYSGTSRTVVIPSKIAGKTVASVAGGVFTDNTALTSVDLGGVESIGATCFAGCTSLSAVTASSNLKSVGINAFLGTPYLESRMKEEFPTLGDGVLIACVTEASSVTVPSGVRHIGGGVFSMNGRITCADLGPEVISVGEQAFAFCESLRYVNAPSLEYIGEFAFCGCTELPAFDFSERIGFIGENAFADCYRLVYVCLGGRLETLTSGTFANCQNIRLCRIPGKVGTIRSSAFSGCLVFVIQTPGTMEELMKSVESDGVFFIDDMYFVSDR